MTYLKSGRPTDCSGCRACEQICPKQCICMEADDEGFLYPKVNPESCIHCHLCEKTCPQEFDGFYPNDGVSAFVGVHEDPSVTYCSSSGGAFTELYKILLADGYTVYGVRYDENLHVIHDSAQTEELCRSFRKSKYIYSDTNGCFSKIADQLRRNEKVVFSGVSCQCAALRGFLNTKNVKTDNLMVIAVLCHGAPSQELFDQYRAELEEKAHKKLQNYEFKAKRPIGGKINTRTAVLHFSDGTERHVNVKTDAFLRAYYRRLIYRPACGSCRFARPERISDITLADAWNIPDILPRYDPVTGVSLIMAATEKGKAAVERILSPMRLESVDAEWALHSQDVVLGPTKFHKNRAEFFRIRKQIGFHRAVRRITHDSILKRLRSKFIHYSRKLKKHLKK